MALLASVTTTTVGTVTGDTITIGGEAAYNMPVRDETPPAPWESPSGHIDSSRVPSPPYLQIWDTPVGPALGEVKALMYRMARQTAAPTVTIWSLSWQGETFETYEIYVRHQTPGVYEFWYYDYSIPGPVFRWTPATIPFPDHMFAMAIPVTLSPPAWAWKSAPTHVLLNVIDTANPKLSVVAVPAPHARIEYYNNYVRSGKFNNEMAIQFYGASGSSGFDAMLKLSNLDLKAGYPSLGNMYNTVFKVPPWETGTLEVRAYMVTLTNVAPLVRWSIIDVFLNGSYAYTHGADVAMTYVAVHSGRYFWKLEDSYATTLAAAAASHAYRAISFALSPNSVADIDNAKTKIARWMPAIPGAPMFTCCDSIPGTGYLPGVHIVA